MKTYKIIAAIVLVFCCSLGIINYLQSLTEIKSPLSDKVSYQQRLNNALQLASLNPINLTYRDYQNEIEFYIISNHNKKSIKIILSTQKDPYWQISQIKQILVQHSPKLIDLSLKHPYASL